MFNSTKHLVYKILCNVKKTNWKQSGEIKVLVGVNDFFTENAWKKLLENDPRILELNWDVHFYTRKIDLYRHFLAADICFLFGLGPFLIPYLNKSRFFYFPMLGKEFLNKIVFSKRTIIEHPPSVSSKALAEYCLAMSVALTRNLHLANFNQYQRKWNQKNILDTSFKPLASMKIGILGLGNVGTSIAECFLHNNAMVYGCDEVINKDETTIAKWFHVQNLKAFLREIDILIIALPLTERTKHIIDAEALSSLGKNSYLINISRGEVVNEADLAHALKQNIIKGAALDVFCKEPLSRSSSFYKLNNVIITPHIAGNINLFVDTIQQDFIKKATKYSLNV